MRDSEKKENGKWNRTEYTDEDKSIDIPSFVNGSSQENGEQDMFREEPEIKEKKKKIYEKHVMKFYKRYKWNQNQFDALVSFAYNIGSIYNLTANGTRTKKEISRKILAYNKANGKTLEGLTRRRKAEKKLFDKPVKK